MATQPMPPDQPVEDDDDPGAPNPSRLPVEPEFGPQPPASEPEDPLAQRPTPV
jgi:hypothetical protein